MADKKCDQLFRALQKKGYPEVFCSEIAYKYLNTDFTADRMLSYLSGFDTLGIEELVDEMYAIISDRDRIVEKHLMENAQSKINEMYRFGLGVDDEE